MPTRFNFIRSSATPLLAGTLGPFMIGTNASANLLFPMSRPQVGPLSVQPRGTSVRRTSAGGTTDLDLVLNSNAETIMRISFNSDSYKIATMSGQSATHHYNDKFAPNTTYTTPWGTVTLGSNLSGQAKTSNGRFTFTAAITGTRQSPSITFTCPEIKQTGTISIPTVSGGHHITPQFWGSPGCNQALYNYVFAVLEMLNGWAEMIWGIIFLDPILYWQGVIDYEQGYADEQDAIAEINENC